MIQHYKSQDSLIQFSITAFATLAMTSMTSSSENQLIFLPTQNLLKGKQSK